MRKADNENEQFSFISIGAATRNVVRYLEQERREPPNGGEDKSPQEKADRQREHDAAVEAGGRRIERFEARYRRNRP